MKVNKKYILMLSDSEGNHAIGLSLGRMKLLLVFLIILLLLLPIGYLLYRTIHHGHSNYQLMGLKKENALLKQTFMSWENRLEMTENSLQDLKKRNQQIRMTAGLTVPDVELGIGGPEHQIQTIYMDSKELNQFELDLTSLESEVDWMKQNTIELDQIITSRIKEIAHFPSIRPIRKGWITSRFGNRTDPFTGVVEDHPGLDIATPPGTEVWATGAGKVKKINKTVIKNKGYGKYIVIDHGYGYETLYAHLSEIFVEKGQRIKRWDLIGLTGNTGRSTAPHIHYGVMVNRKYQDPENFILE